LIYELSQIGKVESCQKKKIFLRSLLTMIKLPVSYPKIDDRSKLTLAIIACFALGLLLMLSIFQMAGQFSLYVSSFLWLLLGRCRILIPIGFFFAGFKLIQIQNQPDVREEFNYRLFWGIFLIVTSICGFASLFARVEFLADIESGGGLIGYILYPYLFRFFGSFGAFVLLSCVFLFGVLVISQKTITQFYNDLLFTCGKAVENPLILIDNIGNISKMWKTQKQENTSEIQDSESKESVVYIDQKAIPSSKVEQMYSPTTEITNIFRKTKKRFAVAKSDDSGNLEMEPIAADASNWKRPPISMLKENLNLPDPGPIDANKLIISSTLEHFGIKVTMGDVYVGPTVTQYTLKPDNGVRLSAIDGLQRDLALSLAAPSIRIEAPISGQSLVGVEIPNKVKSQVRLHDIVADQSFEKNDDLPVVVGKDVRGNKILYGLAKMPHMLVAGATGSGKSVWINGLLLSLLSKYSPDDLQLILVDMKRVELKLYEGVPHLMSNVITEAEKAINALKWTVLEMDKRYSSLETHGKRNIKDFNTWIDSLKDKDWPEGETKKPRKLPYLVFVIDELGDLMMLAKSEVEPIIVRLTQMSRAVGIHIVLGTQRPDTHVVTGLIKANIPTRISFAVASQIDSRVILDVGGAEKLLGQGDGLFMSPTTIKPIRFQGALVEDDEIKDYVAYLKRQSIETGKDNKNHAVTEVQKTRINVPGMSTESDDTTNSQDDVFEEAKRIVVQYQKASTSFLQQMMGIGYPRAAKIINRMEEMGLIGPQNGSKPRDVYTLPEDDMLDSM
jgi:DNA segregation ATPase FtsK/SpoIIIE, S-DNA-T family